MAVLVVAEHECGIISASAHHVVTAAVELAFITAGEVHVLVAGDRCEDVAETAAEISGVMKVICVATNAEDGVLPSIVDVVSSRYSHIVFAATPASTAFAEQLASMLNVRCVRNVVKVISEDAFERDGEAGRVVVRCRDRVVVLTAEITKFPNAGCFGHASIEVLKVKQEVPPGGGLGHGAGRSRLRAVPEPSQRCDSRFGGSNTFAVA